MTPAESLLDASVLRRWVGTVLTGLAHARAEIDALNVYPVPDGDTGTNLLLTWESVVEAGEEQTGEDLGAVAMALARGALLGARGNSGVILSQMLRGGAVSFVESGAETSVDGGQLAAALNCAADAGYAAVAQPVEGTMLTVMRGAADAAAALAESGSPTVVEVMRAAWLAAREALERTPDQLDVLRLAGVVDAGGRGLVVLFDAALTSATGVPVAAMRPAPAPVHSVSEVAIDGPAFEVMYLLEAADEAVPALRSSLAALGDSLLVVGGDRLWNVHVHTDDVGAAIEAGLMAGRPYRIRVTHFEQQRTAPAITTRVVVAVAAGDELARLLEGSGAAVVRHAADARPATRDLLAAIDAAPGADVVLLPDDRDTTAVAEAAASEARQRGRRVAVLPTTSPLQVVAAVAVHDPGAPFDEAVVRMTAAARGTRTGAVTVAARESLTSAGVCRPGDVLGMIDREVVVIGAELSVVAAGVADLMLASGGELVTVLPGRDAPPDLVGSLVAHLRGSHPEVDVDVLPGGQPHYPLLLGVE